MAEKKLIVNDSGIIGAPSKKAPKILAVHPYGSKILVETIPADELLDTNLIVPDNATSDGAPQAYIIEIGPQVPVNSGLKVGQRVYWTGKGTAVNDPRAASNKVRALLEIHNIQAIISEEGSIV